VTAPFGPALMADSAHVYRLHQCVQDRAVVYEDGGVDTGPGSIADRQGTFSDCLYRAIHLGARSGGSCMGIDDETFDAINAVADEFPNATIESIAGAHEEFAREIRGVHFFESRAAVMACRAGVIPQQVWTEPVPTSYEARDRAPGDDTAMGTHLADEDQPITGKRKKRIPSEYGADSITVIVPDPAAERAWILANRTDPSDLYRRYVINGDWRPGCSD
jgi:hypothetical protein